MTRQPDNADRLRFLARVIEREMLHLQQTDNRLFAEPLRLAQLENLERNQDLAERIEAFVGRFGRLQDSLGDKLLPRLLRLVEERPGTFVDNLDRAEAIGWITDADTWLVARKLRNQMVHEYIEDLGILLDALNSGHELVALLMEAGRAMVEETRRRLDADGQSCE